MVKFGCPIFQRLGDSLMNKKLLAVAVAGALSAPVVAQAQSSVTISGNIKMSLQQYKISNASAARAGASTSQSLIHDDSSRIIFNMTEDLGGGLQAIAQIDWRVVPDSHVSGGGVPPGHLGREPH